MKKLYHSLGSDELLTKLPAGHTMSMGYMSEKYYSETEIMAVLLELNETANDAEKCILETIKNLLRIE